MFYLTGQTPEQTRKDKFIIIWKNIKSLLIYPLVDKTFQQSNIRCDYCSKRTKNGIITFLNEDNSEEHPFLYSPQLFHYSHPECTPNIDDYCNYFNKNDDIITALSNVKLEKYSIKEYKTEIFPNLCIFFDEQKKERKKTWANYKERPDHSEVEARKIYERVLKL